MKTEADRTTTKGGLGRRLAKHVRTLGITLSLLLLLTGFSLLAPLHDTDFLTWYNIQTMASQSVSRALCAMGMTLIIISGGIDLSVGSVVALSMVVTAWCIDAGAWLWAAAFGGVLTGALAGLINGLLVTSFRIVPFIATLGMMGIARGLAKLIANSQQINIGFEGWRESWMALMTFNPPHPFPPPGSTNLLEPVFPRWLLFAPTVWILIAVAALMVLVLRCTIFGKYVFAIGSNEAAARLCGLRVPMMKVVIYSVAGLFTGLAGVVFCSRGSQGDPTAALGFELDVIAAVVIGGGSLRGGEGSILGSLAGALIMIVLRTGLRMINAPAPAQEILIGTIIIIAVVVDQLQHRRVA